MRLRAAVFTLLAFALTLIGSSSAAARSNATRLAPIHKITHSTSSNWSGYSAINGRYTTVSAMLDAADRGLHVADDVLELSGSASRTDGAGHFTLHIHNGTTGGDFVTTQNSKKARLASAEAIAEAPWARAACCR
jgi:hypothetical protein